MRRQNKPPGKKRVGTPLKLKKELTEEPEN
jgi:hypothetical protein